MATTRNNRTQNTQDKKPTDKRTSTSRSAKPAPRSNLSIRVKAVETKLQEIREEIKQKSPSDSALPQLKEQFEALKAEFNDLRDSIAAGDRTEITAKVVKLETDAAAIYARLDKIESFGKETRSQVDSLRSTVHDLGERVADDHDSIVSIVQRLGELDIDLDLVKLSLEQGQIGGQKAIITLLRERKVSDEKIKNVLGIVTKEDGELVLTDPEVTAELFTRLDSFMSTTTEHLTRHDTQIGVLYQNDVEIVNRLSQVEKSTSSSSKVPLIVGLVVGVIAWWLVAVNVDDHSGWWEFGMGVALGVIAAGLASFFTSDKFKSRVQESSVVQAAKSGYQEGRARATSTKSTSTQTTVKQTAGSDNPRGSSASDDRTTEVPAQRQTAVSTREQAAAGS